MAELLIGSKPSKTFPEMDSRDRPLEQVSYSHIMPSRDEGNGEPQCRILRVARAGAARAGVTVGEPAAGRLPRDSLISLMAGFLDGKPIWQPSLPRPAGATSDALDDA